MPRESTKIKDFIGRYHPPVRKEVHNMTPRPESRIKSLEQRASDIEAGIIELSSDTAEELKVIRQEIKQGHIDIGKSLDSHAEALMQEIRKLPTREDLGNLITVQDARFDKIEDDIAELKSMMKQLLQQKD